MNLGGDMYSKYYRALSLYHLRKFTDAQKSISEAIAIDIYLISPAFISCLLKFTARAGRPRRCNPPTFEQFVKYSGSRQDRDSAREFLAELQAQQNTK